MKREFPQKVRFVPSPSPEKEALVKFSACKLGLFRQAHPEGNRRVRTSAAMIGLAISMGASSLFLPRQGDRAFAAEPIKAEPTAKRAISSLDETAWLPVTDEVTPAAQTVIAIPEAKALPRHAEQEDSRLLPLSPEVDSTEIALPVTANEPSYSISSEPVLLAEPRLNIPEATSFEEFQVVSPANTLVVPLAVNSPIADDVNELFKAKQEVLKANQEVAIKDLQRSSNRLKNGLAELRSEESASSSQWVTEPGQNPSVANPITNFSYPSVVAEREVLVPVIPAASPEAEFKNVPLIVSTPETAGTQNPAFVPVVPAASPEAAIKSVPLIVPTPETTVVPAPEMAASPLEDKQPVFTPSQGVEVPDMSQAVVIATEDRQTVVVPSNAVKEAKANVYRVNSGDTVGVIAQNYGVSQSELIHANELSDPNFINVDQTLKIPVADAGKPQAQTMTLIANSNVAPEAAYNPTANTELIEEKQVPNLVIPQPASALNPTLRLVTPGNPEVVGSFSSSIESKPNESANVAVVPVQPNQSLESEVNHKSNPYVEGLRAEVLKLREKYQTQKVSNQGNAAIATPTPVVPSVMNLSVPTREISNPEFNPAQPRESLQGKLPQQARLGTRSGQVTQPAPEQAPIVATAPIGVDGYDQIQPRMVSPDLPPLAPAERYLPNGAASFNGYIWPAKGEMTSGYGWRWGRMHAGIDVAGPIGTPIVAAAPGVITYASWNEGGYGNLVEIQHPDGSLTLYAHNDRILVREGQQVDQGQQIAEMGSTGFSTGPHLHFEVHRRGQGAIDPIAMLPQ
ncbi:MAG: peptidoglycan DD-metalloendopeptidase family protein [Microcoleus vaginatus WJT46-NPBG5]|nr:peptidoglycan DD-metalloendopeptidase family protein [Microcoleus vaginatus WJT46-NPBG5]